MRDYSRPRSVTPRFRKELTDGSFPFLWKEAGVARWSSTTSISTRAAFLRNAPLKNGHRTRGYFGPTKPELIKYAIVVSVPAIKASRHVVFTAAARPGRIRAPASRVMVRRLRLIAKLFRAFLPNIHSPSILSSSLLFFLRFTFLSLSLASLFAISSVLSPKENRV